MCGGVVRARAGTRPSCRLRFHLHLRFRFCFCFCFPTAPPIPPRVAGRAPALTIQHAASAGRDSIRRPTVGLRNTLWFTWLRRPPRAALRRTGHLLRTVPRDAASARAFAQAARGLPWVLRERRPVTPEIERRLGALEHARRDSPARR